MSPTEQTNSSVLDFCESLEVRIEMVQRLMLDPKPESLDHAVAELAEVVTALQALATSKPQKANSTILPALHKIRSGARTLSAQIDQASNFCRGWIQMRLGTGYSDNGLPIFVQSEARSSFEG